jgi:GntR family transcriptional regulator
MWCHAELEGRLTASTRRPKYRQIADDLRAKITNGTYPVGSTLPSTSQLMQAYDVSVTVARAAIKELQNEGIAEGQPGKAVYVQREPRPAEPSAEYREITQQIEALREAFGQAVQQLDDRLTKLEQTTARSVPRSR